MRKKASALSCREIYTNYTEAPIGIRTQVSGFKVLSDNHYTIGAELKKFVHEEGFEPSQLALPGLKSGSLDHSDIRAIFILYDPTHHTNCGDRIH